MATAQAAIGFDADMPLLSTALADIGVAHQAVVWEDRKSVV